jgi:membrane protease YdiL (CAAX protease family)
MKTYYKKYFLFSCVFLIFSSVVSNATMIGPSPANSLKMFLQNLLFLLLIIISVLLIISVLKMLFSKDSDLKKVLKMRVLRRVALFSTTFILLVFVKLFYCEFMVLVLGKDHKFFNMSLMSCNSFMGCPDMSNSFQCD